MIRDCRFVFSSTVFGGLRLWGRMRISARMVRNAVDFEFERGDGEGIPDFLAHTFRVSAALLITCHFC